MHLHRVSRIVVAASLVLLFYAAAPALATVTLNISDNDASPTGAAVPQGANFSFTVRLVSTSEQVTGLDYYLTSPESAGVISIVDRNTVGGMFNDPLFFNDATVESSPSSLLNPRNDHDLGGLSTGTLGAGTYTVANFTLNVAPGAPDGFYTIQTVSNPGEGWINGSSQEFPFDSHGTFTVFVPEPGALALFGLALPAVIRRRRI